MGIDSQSRGGLQEAYQNDFLNFQRTRVSNPHHRLNHNNKPSTTVASSAKTSQDHCLATDDSSLISCLRHIDAKFLGEMQKIFRRQPIFTEFEPTSPSLSNVRLEEAAAVPPKSPARKPQVARLRQSKLSFGDGSSVNISQSSARKVNPNFKMKPTPKPSNPMIKSSLKQGRSLSQKRVQINEQENTVHEFSKFLPPNSKA